MPANWAWANSPINSHGAAFPLTSLSLSLLVEQPDAMAQPQQARSAVIILALAIVGHCLLGHTEATDFVVGDAGGWRFNVIDWPNGKSFKTGDVLGMRELPLKSIFYIYIFLGFPLKENLGWHIFAVFNYTQGVHTVVAVSEDGYDNCSPSGGKVFTSGNDRITLVTGDSYFICGVTGHCAANMKIKVTAAWACIRSTSITASYLEGISDIFMYCSMSSQ